MTEPIYTAITFAPIQSFIENSRKLRDLYGSSYLLSYLARSLCLVIEAEYSCEVISPALANVTQGMPNQIIVKGVITPTQPESEQVMQAVFVQAWTLVVENCRTWIETQLNIKPLNKTSDHKGWQGCWQREWKQWANYAWEFFLVQGEKGESITQVRQRLNDRKRSRHWTGVNWQGESSTLSGADAIAFPGMGRVNPKRGYEKQDTNIHSYFENLTETLTQEGIIEALYQDGVLKNRKIETQAHEVRAFYRHLSRKLGEAFALKNNCDGNGDKHGEPFIDPREELSIPELVKRLITHQVVVEELVQRVKQSQKHHSQEFKKALEELNDELRKDLDVKSFKELNRLPQKNPRQSVQPVHWTGWFMGDSDGASDYLRAIGKGNIQKEEKETQDFSKLMRQWSQEFKDQQEQYLPDGYGRVIYAGGDDFLGVLYRPEKQLPPRFCCDWLSTFKSQIWDGIDPENKGQSKPISPSVGFVWAGPNIPQREVLQQCRQAEKSAKQNGKDRIAFRILFNSGTYLEWICPWWLLEEGLLQSYCDRNRVTGETANWTHLYNDVAALEARHAFENNQCDIALGLLEIYFCQCFRSLLADEDYYWNQNDENDLRRFTGILGDKKLFLVSQDNDKIQPETEPQLNSKRINQAINKWVINLAKVGFHLHQD